MADNHFLNYLFKSRTYSTQILEQKILRPANAVVGQVTTHPIGAIRLRRSASTVTQFDAHGHASRHEALPDQTTMSVSAILIPIFYLLTIL